MYTPGKAETQLQDQQGASLDELLMGKVCSLCNLSGDQAQQCASSTELIPACSGRAWMLSALWGVRRLSGAEQAWMQPARR